jgi:hypothetical protein
LNRRSPVPVCLQENINHLTILVYSQPELMLLAVDLNGPAHRARGNGEDFIDEEGIAITSVLALQSACKNGAELDAEPAP